ncbi:unnamed protein product [Orchesella dallaii]|uniref:Ankyrin repeat protein n=1 Tax=Orchesella dallaii TaxID=48710 RepID=A0ABP1PMD1_9HEXA
MVDFNAVTFNDDPVLFKAIEKEGDEPLLNALIEFGADWTIRNKKRDTPLHNAAYYNNLHAVKLFIRLNCDVNAKNVCGETPLHKAIISYFKPSHDVINELIINGANPLIKNNYKKSPVDFANERVEKCTLHLLLTEPVARKIN